jgi:hypothetical protein
MPDELGRITGEVTRSSRLALVGQMVRAALAGGFSVRLKRGAPPPIKLVFDIESYDHQTGSGIVSWAKFQDGREVERGTVP